MSFFHLSAPDFLLGMDSNPASRNVFGLIAAELELARGGIRELSQLLATVDLAIFVDAYPVSTVQQAQVLALEPCRSDLVTSHTSDPRVLLTLAQVLYGYHPQAWLIAVPAVNFELGNRLSSVAQRGIAQALEQINALLDYGHPIPDKPKAKP